MRALRISPASAHILDSGHPWVLRDEGTGETDAYRPGEVVDLVDPKGGFVARAMVDPRSRIVARVLARRRVTVDEAFVAQRARAALDLRRDLAGSADTDTYRLIDAEGDGLPGLEVDRFGDTIVAVRRTPAAGPLCAPVYEVLSQAYPGATVYEKDHYRDLRTAEDLAGRLIAGSDTPREREARERGLSFEVRPFGGLATGLFADQRENRALLASRRPRTVLNAFCFTGAFTVALAAAGARVTSVDQSRGALQTLRGNLARNGIDPDVHPVHEADARHYLQATRDRFDLIVLDPPTFATGRQRGHWSARTGYGALAALAFDRLREGGELFASINDRRATYDDLVQALWEGARGLHRDLQIVTEGRTGSDFPWLGTFREGRTHRAVLVRLI